MSVVPAVISLCLITKCVSSCTGIPLLYASILLKHRETLGDNKAMDQEIAAGYPTVGHLSFLVDAYKPSFFMFEVSAPCQLRSARLP